LLILPRIYIIELILYLDSIYPEHRLTPTDPFVKAKHQILIETFSNNVTSAFYKIMRKEEDANYEMNTALEYFEKNLDGNFFGGEKEAMVDYMIWPWYIYIL
jgi:glutathione S-transferase